MRYHTEVERREGGRRGARGLSAIIAVVVLALALAACGGDDNKSSSSSSSSSSGGSSEGVSKAKSQLEQYKSPPTKILITEPLKSAPPKGKKLIMLGTGDPNNQKLQKSLKSLAALVGWVGSWLSMREESTPGAVPPTVPRRPTPDAG